MNVNTEINYLYRDGENFKFYNRAVLQGELTKELIDEIISCLDGGEYFIPSAVGLPEERFEEETDADHRWFELNKSGFNSTQEKPTVKITAIEFYNLFLLNKGFW